MICICLGPTKLLDPTRRLVTVPTSPLDPGKTDDGFKPVWEHAGMVQDRLHAALGPDICEHRHGVQHRQDGVFVTPMRTETSEERYYRRMATNGVEDKVARQVFRYTPATDPFDDEPLQLLQAGPAVKQPQPPEYVATDAVKAACGGQVDLTWFPAGFAFGNGVTTNSWVPLTNPVTGERKDVLLSWCVLSPSAAVLHKADAGARANLRTIMEPSI